MFERCSDPFFFTVGSLNETTSPQITIRTARCYVKVLNWHDYTAIQKLFFNKKYFAPQILWARSHENWTEKKCINEMFRNEWCFTVHLKKNRLHVRQHRRERLRKQFMVPTFKFGYQKVSAWGVFYVSVRSTLVATIGSFDQNAYRVIVYNHVKPLVHDIHKGNWEVRETRFLEVRTGLLHIFYHSTYTLFPRMVSDSGKNKRANLVWNKCIYNEKIY